MQGLQSGRIASSLNDLSSSKLQTQDPNTWLELVRIESKYQVMSSKSLVKCT